jgi:alkanesulfonate monooxygenase SsuD/methylene tetrahydromethanopterin reductase-like flavin-dependent oxidoreductase (luciferase family)
MGIKIGLTLPNRGVLFGATTPAELIDLAEIADNSGFQSVWVGDSLFGKPRLESVALLAGIASRTKHVRLGPACLASYALRDPVWLAYQWASLDQIAGGRTVLVACNGNVSNDPVEVENTLFKVDRVSRIQRVVEWTEIIKSLWTEDEVSFHGKHYNFDGVSVAPKPAASPRPPIWLAVNAPSKEWDKVQASHRKVVNHFDGWQTASSNKEDLARRIEDLNATAEAAGKDPQSVEKHLYHNVNLNDNQGEAVEESKKFLDLYYTSDRSLESTAAWVATGTAEQVIERIKGYEEIGFDEITLRITSWNQREQLARFIEEVLPEFSPVAIAAD